MIYKLNGLTHEYTGPVRTKLGPDAIFVHICAFTWSSAPRRIRTPEDEMSWIFSNFSFSLMVWFESNDLHVSSSLLKNLRFNAHALQRNHANQSCARTCKQPTIGQETIFLQFPFAAMATDANARTERKRRRKNLLCSEFPQKGSVVSHQDTWDHWVNITQPSLEAMEIFSS